MWNGPKLKFKRSKVKVEEVAALLYENWGGDKWGHTILCSPVDYHATPRSAPSTDYALFDPIDLQKEPSDEQIKIDRFSLRPADSVPEGEAWLVPITVLID